MGVLIKLFIEDVRKDLNIMVWNDIAKIQDDNLVDPVATFIVPLYIKDSGTKPNQCKVFNEEFSETNDNIHDSYSQSITSVTHREPSVYDDVTNVNLINAENTNIKILTSEINETKQESGTVKEIINDYKELFDSNTTNSIINENIAEAIALSKTVSDEETKKAVISYSENAISENLIVKDTKLKELENTAESINAELESITNVSSNDDAVFIDSDDYTLEIIDDSSFEEDSSQIIKVIKLENIEYTVSDDDETATNISNLSLFTLESSSTPIKTEQSSTEEEYGIEKVQHNKRKLNEETKPKWSRDHKRLKRKQSVDAKNNKEEQYFCKPCKKSFSHKISLEKHLTSKSCFARLETCKYCNKLFFSGLKKHLITFHQMQISNENITSSSDCFYRVQDHISKTKQDLQYISSNTEQNLESSENTFMEDKYRKMVDKYHCIICNRTFDNIQDVNLHEQSHKNEKQSSNTYSPPALNVISGNLPVLHTCAEQCSNKISSEKCSYTICDCHNKNTQDLISNEDDMIIDSYISSLSPKKSPSVCDYSYANSPKKDTETVSDKYCSTYKYRENNLDPQMHEKDYDTNTDDCKCHIESDNYTCNQVQDLRIQEKIHKEKEHKSHTLNISPVNDDDSFQQDLRLREQTNDTQNELSIPRNVTPVYRCSLCAYTCKKATDLKLHKRKKHVTQILKETSLNDFHCIFCTYTCHSKIRLRKHRNKYHKILY